MVEYREFDSKQINRVKEIFEAEEWNAYLQDDKKLAAAFENSLYLLGAFLEDRLIGFIRCVGDGEHILVVQDLIVAKEYQRNGIGTFLLKRVWEKYKDVRMFFAVTDLADEGVNHFYQSFGMKPLAEGQMIAYFR